MSSQVTADGVGDSGLLADVDSERLMVSSSAGSLRMEREMVGLKT